MPYSRFVFKNDMYAQTGNLFIYFLICIGISVLFLHRTQIGFFSLYMFSVFYEGVFQFISPIVHNIFQMSQALLLLAWFFSSIGRSNLSKKAAYLLAATMFMTVSFFMSELLNESFIPSVIPTYIAYLTPPLYLIAIHYMLSDTRDVEKHVELVYRLVLLQIVFYGVKYIMFGVSEALAGTTSLSEGSSAALFPVVVMFFVLLIKKPSATVARNLIILSSFIVPLVGGKRAVWFYFPLALLLYALFVSKRITWKHLFIYIWIIPVVMYFGIRLSPTLNEDKKVWGAFTPGYTYEYVMDYNYGRESIRDSGYRAGRMGVNQAVLERASSLSKESFIGYGVNSLRGSYWDVDVHQFSLEGITGRAGFSATGFTERFLTQGIMGVLALVIIYFTMLSFCRQRGIKLFMLAMLFLVTYTYTNVLYLSRPIMTVFFFSMIYSNRHINPTFKRHS